MAKYIWEHLYSDSLLDIQNTELFTIGSEKSCMRKVLFYVELIHLI
jgi:hypothetical protein